MEHRIVVEFFHDVLCAWCYVLSPRVRRLVAGHPEVEVVHRAFALAPSPEDLVRMFGSAAQAKEEILGHWRAANRYDDDHRIDADRMAARIHPYPHSMPGLLACKAAEVQGGQEGHWAMFDRVQRAHLTECLDITDPEVLTMCATEVGLDVRRWQEDVQSPAVREAVERDRARALLYGVHAVPTLVADGRHVLSGARPYGELEAWATRVKKR
ncbi:DsbA family oxidoreductase [Caldinitratiruptor microaerophilus]|uniref:Thioredoxin n=1 Tax=Caldinitratiruptor microaerophilus TaxID=671077 RepID=A0AA35G779_9FIRM|nr:DsbA family protein [Caldinitratiruptor microaerophilus]BDG62386.1 thioredoxin [Caldinitratiruptor microaerophilus]